MNRQNQMVLHEGKKLVVYVAVLLMTVGFTRISAEEEYEPQETEIQSESTERVDEVDEIEEMADVEEAMVTIFNMPAFEFEQETESTYEEEVYEPEADELEADKFDEHEQYLLAKIAMAEAEGEDLEGKALVIRVVLNRVECDYFPDTIEEVVFQKNQFTPIRDGRWDRVEPNKECYKALEMVLEEGWDESCGALYFGSKKNSSWHSENLKYLFQHGNHYFYTERGLVG